MPTIEEFQNMPEDGNLYEFIHGEIQMLASPSVDHQRITRQLSRLFSSASCDLEGEFFFAPIDLYISGQVRIPDFVFIRNENLHIVKEQRIEGAPDLIAEIISRSNSKNDLIDKFRLYEKSGVKEYWIIQPEYEIVDQLILADGAYQLKGKLYGQDLLESPIVKCAKFAVADLFAGKIHPNAKQDR